MEAALCIIFALFAVYGVYSALRETVVLISRLRGKAKRGNDLCTGCTGCVGFDRWGLRTEEKGRECELKCSENGEDTNGKSDK